MKIDFPYPGYEGIAPVEVPDRNLMGVYSPRTFEVDEAEVTFWGLCPDCQARRREDAAA